MKTPQDTTLLKTRGLSELLQKQLKSAGGWDAFSAALEKTDDTGESTKLAELITKVKEKGLARYIFNEMIWPNVPEFLYFDDYYQMKGCANLNALVDRENTETLEKSDHPLLGLTPSGPSRSSRAHWDREHKGIDGRSRSGREPSHQEDYAILVAKSAHRDVI